MYIYKHELYIFENKLNSNLLLSIGFFPGIHPYTVYTAYTEAVKHTFSGNFQHPFQYL